MEEKKKDLSELSSEGSLNVWVTQLNDRAKWVQEKLKNLSSFKNPIQTAEFKRLIDGKFLNNTGIFAHCNISEISLGAKSLLNDHPRYFRDKEQIKKLLLDYGLGWKHVAEKIYYDLELIIPTISKIRRNLLYPEVAEMEKVLAALKIEHIELERQHSDRGIYLVEKEIEIKRLKREIENYNNFYARLSDEKLEIKTQLAEKEEEIKKLNSSLDASDKITEEIVTIKQFLSQFDVWTAESASENVKRIIEKFQSQLTTIHDILELCVNVEKNKDDFRRYFPSKNPENCAVDAEKIWNIFVGKCELKAQLAALQIEHTELEKQHSDRAVYLAEKEIELTQWKTGFLELCKAIKNITLNSKDESNTQDKSEKCTVVYSLIKGYLWDINLLKEADNKILAIEVQLTEQEKEIAELEAEYEKIDISAIKQLLFQFDGWTEEGILKNIERVIKRFQFQLAEKEKEIVEWKNKADAYQSNWWHAMNDDRYPKLLAEKEKEMQKEIEKNKQHGARIEFLEYMIERTIIALDQTKKIFKSKTIAHIRWELTNILPIEKQTKFIGIQPSEPWPRTPLPSRECKPRPPQICKTCDNTRKIACPACGDSKIIGSCACCKGHKEINCPDCNPGNKPKAIEPTPNCSRCNDTREIPCWSCGGHKERQPCLICRGNLTINCPRCTK